MKAPLCIACGYALSDDLVCYKCGMQYEMKVIAITTKPLPDDKSWLGVYDEQQKKKKKKLLTIY